MNFKTTYQNETICESNNGYGTGGAFPPLAPIIEDEAQTNLAMFLFPKLETLEEIESAHKLEAICPTARNREEKGEVLDSGDYAVTVTIDGQSYEVNVSMNW